MLEIIEQTVEKYAPRYTKISDQIWEYAELRYNEQKSSDLLKSILVEEGFIIESDIGDIPTAFIGSYGKGSPIIGILGEYDALPGLSQKLEPIKNPIVDGGTGHGCGHNLLGVGSLAACITLKNLMDQNKISGTIRYYGCPAEEGGSGKVFMIHEGVFDDVDVCLTWHPEDLNMVQVQNWEAVISLKYRFYGQSAHAAGDPHNGRSALDAVELMNVGANYLREHILPNSKLHYIITHGGDAPNIVPDFAESYYYIRAPVLKQVFDILARLDKVAEGASLMTETRFEHEIMHGDANYLPNNTIENVLYEQMNAIGFPHFDDHDRAFAAKIRETLPKDFFENLVAKVPNEYRKLADGLKSLVLCEAILPIFGRDVVLGGSTDVGDVSWIVPTAQFTTACFAIGSPGHSWQRVAQGGMSIGHKGMLNAAKILAASAVQFYTQPSLIAKAKSEFSERRKNNPYQSAIPRGNKPIFD